ncbi:MAG: OmpA family protein [Segetibacter sp.]|nr:OmpA family protein [Segetibacter sp.]
MKKILLIVFVVALSSKGFSQTFSSSKKPPTIGFSFMLNDFRTPTILRNSSFSSVLSEGEFSSLKEMSWGILINYSQGIFEHVDFVGTLGGSFVNYPFKNRTSSSKDAFLLHADANVNVKLLNDSYILNPYATAGIGASLYQVYYGAYIPAGVGLQVRLSEESLLFTQAQYRFGITDNTADHFNFQLGFAIPLSLKN